MSSFVRSCIIAMIPRWWCSKLGEEDSNPQAAVCRGLRAYRQRYIIGCMPKTDTTHHTMSRHRSRQLRSDGMLDAAVFGIQFQGFSANFGFSRIENNMR